MINLREKSIKKISDGFDKLIENKKDKLHLGNYSINFNFGDEITFKDIVINHSNSRFMQNILNNVCHTKKFRRSDSGVEFNPYKESETEKIISLMSMTSELLLSQIIFSMENNEKLKIELPNPVEYKSGSSVDFTIHNHSFDLKSGFNDRNITINQRKLDTSMKNNNFFILAIINGDRKDFNTWNSVDFYYISIDFFRKNSNYVKNNDREGYYSMDINII